MSDKFNTLGVWSTKRPTPLQVYTHGHNFTDPIWDAGIWEIQIQCKRWFRPHVYENRYIRLEASQNIVRLYGDVDILDKACRIRPVRRTSMGTFEPTEWPEV